jgi:uncharacterized Zn finger protein (UPF0148 family)
MNIPECPKCNETLKRRWHFCPICGYRVCKVSSEDRAHVLESIVRVAKANPNEWQGACEDLMEYLRISPDEVLAALALQRQDAESEKKKPLFKLDDKAVDQIFEDKLGVKPPSPEERRERMNRDLGKSSSPLPMIQTHGAGVRKQVFEVIVRQAIAGAPWREICEGPMKVNGIDPEDIEAEVARRVKLMGSARQEQLTNPRAHLPLPSQHQFRHLQTKVEEALAKPHDLNEKLVEILKGDLDLRKLILNMIAQDILTGKEWNEGLDRWIKIYELSPTEIEVEIRRYVRGDDLDEGPRKERVPKKPLPSSGDTSAALALPKVKQRLVGLRDKIATLTGTEDSEADIALKRAIEQINMLIGTVQSNLPKSSESLPPADPSPDQPDTPEVSEDRSPEKSDATTSDDKTE